MTDAGAPDPRPSDTPESVPSSSTGLEANVAGALAYLLGPITGILFLIVEKESPFVRFHAAQSIGISVALIVFWFAYAIINSVLALVPLVGWIVALLLGLLSIPLALAGFGLWIYLMYTAWQGQEWEIPWVGEQSRKVLL